MNKGVYSVHTDDVDGVALCRMFNTAISTKGVPKYLSSDNDRLFLYHQWQAKLRDFRWQTHCRGIFQLPVAA